MGTSAAWSCGPGDEWMRSADAERVMNGLREAARSAATAFGVAAMGTKTSGGRQNWSGFGPAFGQAFPAAWFGGWNAAPPPPKRAARGDVRAAILALLAEGPRHGYQLIVDITERSSGAWKPSPGSVYPALSALQDEGLVDDEKVEGRRVFALTADGRAYVDERGEEIGHVFDAFTAIEEPADLGDIKALVAGVAAAAIQVLATGTPTQAQAAREILAQARRDLYRVLADETDEEQGR